MRSASAETTTRRERRDSDVPRWLSFVVLLASALAAGVLPGRIWGTQPFIHESLHSTIEAIGAVAALTGAVLLLRREPADASRAAPAAISFLGMGILDGLHALSRPGQGFVLLHSLASLAGAIGLVLAWVPSRMRRSTSLWTRKLPAAMAAAALAVGVMALLRPAALPAMLRGRDFTAIGVATNVAAGALFLLSAVPFFAEAHRFGRQESFLFGSMGLLFGAAELVVPFSALWDAEWWSWHAVRLTAYCFALWMSQQYVAGLRALNAELVRERTASLEADITRRKHAEEAERFLADASEALATSLDYSATLAQVARLAVPRLADWCTVLLADDDGGLRHVAVACSDPGEKALAARVSRREGPVPHTAASERVFRTMKSELQNDVTDDDLVASAIDAEHLAALRRIGLRSRMVVPLVAQGRSFGVIAFAAAGSHRRYDAKDLALAEEVAHRAALAIVNARLYLAAEQAREQAQQAIRAREDLLAVVSHELRSPLANIALSATMLARHTPSSAEDDRGARAHKAADTILRSADRMNHLISDLLDAAQIEAGGLSVAQVRNDAAALIREAVEMIRPLAEKKRLAIEQQVPAGLPHILADRERILQVLANLLGNSVKFTPEGGVLTVAAEPEGEAVRFTVADTGPGIATDALPHLFDRYWQASHSGRAGTGLGLYIAKGIVEAHGGRLWAESRGRGSTFSFTVPIARAPEDHRAAFAP